MNRRHCAVATTLAMTMGMMGVCSAAARGQAAGGGGGPVATDGQGAAAANAPTPAVAAPVRPPDKAYNDPEASRAEIVNFVALNVQNLLNDSDTAAQSASREHLAGATTVAGGDAPPAFLYEYARALNDALSAKLDPAKTSVRQRINIAIVTARVAYVARNVMLQDTAVKLLKDPAEPVVMWALKAAQPLVPQVLRARGMARQVPPLIEQIAPAVFRHPSGPIYYEAYVALGGADQIIADKLVFDELTKLWQSRLTRYQKEVPHDPAVDGRPVFALTSADMWRSIITTDEVKTGVMQMVADQLSAAAQWADRTPAGDQRDQLVQLAQQCVGGTSVVGSHQNLTKLAGTSAAHGQLAPRALAPGAPIGPIVAPVLQQIMADFKGVKQPPQIGPGPGASGVAQP